MNFISRINKKRNSFQDYSFSATKEERNNLCMSIINSSSLQASFYLLLFLSTFIVAIGLIKNDIILIIGGMIVAPLLSPILSISLSITILNIKVFIRSILVFIISAIATMAVSVFIGLISNFNISDIQIINLVNSFDISNLLIPVAAGAIASFIWAKKELNNSISGVAVTVTLLPPLVNMGLALSTKNYFVFSNSLNIYLFNVLGIIIGSLIIFLLMGFNKSAKTVLKQVEIESKESE